MCDYEDYSFVVKNAYDKIYKLAYKKAKEIYGESLSYLIAERLEKELLFIKKYNYAGYYLLAYKAVSYIRLLGEYVTNRDYSSVLVAFLLGINTANPLPPHYYCADCHYVYFDNSQIDGFDLPDKICPICGRSLKKDGHAISCEMFMGQNGSRLPDFGLMFPYEIEHSVTEYLVNYFVKELGYSENEIRDVIRKTNILSINFLSLTKIGVFRFLEDFTDVSPNNISFDDRKVFEFFSNTDSVGTIYFDSDCTKKVLSCFKQKSFDDLVRIVGIAGGTCLTANDCVAILNDNYDRGNLGELPLYRDDVFKRLMKYGFKRETALEISEYVSRGHFKQSCNRTDEYIGMMRENGISEYYIKVLRKLDYLFPKSRPLVDAINLYRLAWYKVHYPTEYYCAFLSNIFKSGNTIDYDDKYNYMEIIKECADKNINFLEADKEKSNSQLFLPENRNIRLSLNNKQYFADNC